MIEKILQKIVENPKDPKYRRFNLDNRKVHAKIETPLGAMRLLELVGFVIVQDSEETLTGEKPPRYMVLQGSASTKSLEQVLHMMSKYLTVKETLAAPVLRKLEEEAAATTAGSESESESKTATKRIDTEQLYCAVTTLYNIIRNLFISPTSEHLRYINIDDQVFQQRVGSVKELIDMLLQLGYVRKESPRGTYLCFEFDDKCGVSLTSAVHPQIRLLQAVAIDLSNSAKRILPHTPIAKAVSTLRGSHSGDPSKQANLEKVFVLLEKALDKVIEQPLDMNLQSISLDKIKAKYPDVTGVVSLLKLVGFARSDKNILTKDDQAKQVTKIEAIFQLDTNDFDLLRIRRDMLTLLIHNK
ncbi:hypothetical protein RFI_14037 [Reticulomyxa filosa]|uniref:PUB domain-containing protein n=1 Tax=Reticulomyxa filosa TaxID=46433 RepID=X6NB70_RETFI|nr:hypothetical protein RFI_14037 [Reticulomyxa filosa]|eukprot:ETO23148.1 hypothetical protein RFI_14037 [Reticulomyxa filosa]